MWKQDLAEVHFVVVLAVLLNKAKKGFPVVLIHHSVVEHPVDFMTPKSYQFVGISQMRAGYELHSLDNFGKVSQVEHVMALDWSGQKCFLHTFVQLKSGLNQ